MILVYRIAPSGKTEIKQEDGYWWPTGMEINELIDFLTKKIKVSMDTEIRFLNYERTKHEPSVYRA